MTTAPVWGGRGRCKSEDEHKRKLIFDDCASVSTASSPTKCIASHAKAETLRRLRVGDLRRIFRHRYGPVLPDDDAGLDDLRLILFSISLSPKAPVEKMRYEIEVSAPWMSATEAGQLIDLILELPTSERKLSRRQLGERLRLTNAERERLRAWQPLPVDISRDGLAKQRKAKKRARDRARRRKAGVAPRQAYLANSLTKLKPWEAEDICRRTGSGNGPKARVASPRSTILIESAADLRQAQAASGTAQGPSRGNSVKATDKAPTNGQADTLLLLAPSLVSIERTLATRFEH